MISWDRVTPALYQLTEEYPPAKAKEWDVLFHPILIHEDFIYDTVFKAFALRRHWTMSNQFARNMFYLVLEDKGLIFERDVIFLVLNIYQSLCKNEKYWINGNIGIIDGHIDFSEFIQVWTMENLIPIQECEVTLHMWKKSVNV